VAVLHGNRSQAQRTRALDAFKKRQARVMVATDIAGRGIDVDGIDHVVNFDIPNVPEDYVHRIGRTARAGATGDAVSLICPEDHSSVRAIEALIGRAIERRSVGDFAVGAAAPPRSSARNGRGHGKRRTPRTVREPATLPPATAAAPRQRTSGWRGRGTRRRVS